jgi:hypothetical protein
MFSPGMVLAFAVAPVRYDGIAGLTAAYHSPPAIAASRKAP